MNHWKWILAALAFCVVALSEAQQQARITVAIAIENLPNDCRLSVVEAKAWGFGGEPERWSAVMTRDDRWMMYRLPLQKGARTGIYLGKGKILVAESQEDDGI